MKSLCGVKEEMGEFKHLYILTIFQDDLVFDSRGESDLRLHEADWSMWRDFMSRIKNAYFVS